MTSLFRLLFQNREETHPEHPDPRLRTLKWRAGLGDALRAVQKRVEQLPQWRVVYVSQAGGRIYAERRTRRMGWVDEICVRFYSPMENQVEIDVLSASRVGVGDLGQNARNIAELLADLKPPEEPLPGAFSDELPESEPR